MKPLFVILLLMAGCTQGSIKDTHPAQRVSSLDTSLHEGDIIFQTSLSAQSIAIQQATRSRYSHCGMLFKQGNKWYVLEAVQPVKFTSFNVWVARGKDGHFVIKRLANADKVLTPSVLKKMAAVSSVFINRDYDIYFGWDDDKIYCSELVWKIYKRGAGISIGNTQQLQDMDLAGEAVKQKLAERYKSNVPLKDTIITPVAIFNSPLLITVAAK